VKKSRDLTGYVFRVWQASLARSTRESLHAAWLAVCYQHRIVYGDTDLTRAVLE
jgi:hypothetical protein